ncbi:hypothetical protein NAT51_01610 [Flavobacterium amniphilum]|uniref:hypothetical protein n=1 Tax=Flavobacterium amniphilum TaxID=1834035 RepID=UPI00202AC06D|nr:hypothetical protein [Flavobacterium amniphilum]MCL9804203.1 hypothetical protein [Flavobacterium amniphilum]
MKKMIVAFFLTVLIVMAIFSICVFIDRLGMPFNAEGHYFDESSGVTYQEQSVSVYGVLSALLVLLTLVTGLFAGKYLVTENSNLTE